MRRMLIVALFFAACAKELPDALPEGAIQTVVDRSREGRPVIFIGLDGADWKLLEPLMADGGMPALKRIVGGAETRVLLTRHPPLSPLVWTSMMTGVSPIEHRILDFTRLHPQTHQQEPITSDERAMPAIWNMARAGGKSVAVLGLWATHPVEPGIVMTDRERPRDFLAATEEIHRRAVATIREQKPDLTIVYFQGTDEIGHLSAGDVGRARDYYARIDQILGDYRELAQERDATLVIASDHGFDWGGTHTESSTATATAAKWHRNEGVWIRWPANDPARREEARVDQVCATLLEILGLPRGEGLAEAISGASGESVNYRRYFRRVVASRAVPASEDIAKLQALGYLSPAPVVAVTSTRTPQSWNNEGLLLREARREDEAEHAFRQALHLQPEYPSAQHNLDDLLFKRGVRRLKANDCTGAVADLRGVAHPTALVWTGIAAAEGCLGNEEAAAEAYGRAGQPKVQQQ